MSKPVSTKKPNLQYAYFDYEVSAVNSARNIRDGFNDDIIESDDVISVEMASFWLREGCDYLKDVLLEPAIKNLREYFDGTIDPEGKAIKIVFPYRLESAWHWNAAEFVFTKNDDDSWSFRGSKYDPYGLKSDLEGEIYQALQDKMEELFEGIEIKQEHYEDFKFNAKQFGGVSCGMYAAFMLHKLKTGIFTNPVALNGIWEGLPETEQQQRQADLDLVRDHKPELLAKFGKISEVGFVSHKKYLPQDSKKLGIFSKLSSSPKKSEIVLDEESENLLDCIAIVCQKLRVEDLNFLLRDSGTILENALDGYDENKEDNNSLAGRFEHIASYISIALDKIKEPENFNKRLKTIITSIHREKLERIRSYDHKAKSELTKKFETLSKKRKMLSKDLETHLEEYNLYAQGQHGETIMHWAVFTVNSELITLLINKDPKLVRHCDSEKKRSPICWAAKNLLKFKSLKKEEVSNLFAIIELIFGYCDEELLNCEDGDKKSFYDYLEAFEKLAKKEDSAKQYLPRLDKIKKSLAAKKPLETEIPFADLVVDWRSTLDVDVELDDGSRFTLDGDRIHDQLKYVENSFRAQLQSHKLKKSESVAVKKEETAETKVKQGFGVILGNPKTRDAYKKKSVIDARKQTLRKVSAAPDIREAMIKMLELEKEIEEEDLAKMFEKKCSTDDAFVDQFRATLTPRRQLDFIKAASEASEKIDLKAHKEAIASAKKVLSTSSLKPSPSSKKDKDVEDKSEVKVANFVPAHLTFVTNLKGRNRIIKIPVVFDNNTNVYSVYDLWNGHFTTASTRNSLAEESLKLRAKTEDFKGDIDSKYKHSEQALIDLLDSPLFAQKTFRKIIFSITKNRKLTNLISTPDSSHNRMMLDLLEKNKSFRDQYGISLDQLKDIRSLKISHAVLDIHSYRYMCRDCSTSLHHWSNPDTSEYGFINNLDNLMQSSLQDEEKRERATSKIKVVVRTSTDKEFKEQKPKSPEEHVAERVMIAKDKPLTMRIISRDSRGDEIISPDTNPKRRISKYSIATSGGKTEDRQEYQLAYNQASKDEIKRAVKLIEESWYKFRSGAGK